MQIQLFQPPQLAGIARQQAVALRKRCSRQAAHGSRPPRSRGRRQACRPASRCPRRRGPSRTQRWCVRHRAAASRPSSCRDRHRRRRRKSWPMTFGRRAISLMCSRQGCSPLPLMSGTPQWSRTNWTSGARSASAIALGIWCGSTTRSKVRPVPPSRLMFSRNSAPSERSSGTTWSTRRKPLTKGLARWRSR